MRAFLWVLSPSCFSDSAAIWASSAERQVPSPFHLKQMVPERDQAPLAAPGNTEPLGKVGCQEWLGGVLKHYYRKAA